MFTEADYSRIKWQPTVLSFSFSSKELKARDPLARVRSRLEDLDVKTVIPYIIDQTTHVVQNKRNTAKGLQALINGKYIVQDSFVDALVYAATPTDLENVESLSPLESDFDAAWPDANDHLPPAGNEPVHRPVEAFRPNPARLNIFDGYTFVFGDAAQFENLQAPINNGHGKALLYHVEVGVTTAEEIAQFMRNAAGQKGLGSQRNGPGGVVLVRFRAKGSDEAWSIELGNEVALLTNQRVIEQSEFLDAILGNDASPLCRPLPDAPPSASGGEVEASASQDVPAVLVEDSQSPPASQLQSQSQSQPEPSQPSKARGTRPRVRNFTRKVKDFDDGFDMESIPTYTLGEEVSQHSLVNMDVDEVARQPPTQNPTGSDEEEDMVSSLLPGATAMKRRRAEMGQQGARETAPPADREDVRKTKRPKLDVLEAARQHRAAEEEAARRRREEEEARLDSSLKDTDVEQLKNLALVEEMDVPLREPRAATPADDNRRWDDRWNGRKNFKKFRRKGEAGAAPRTRIQTVIVPLEEVVRKDFGIGEHYWVSNRDDRSRRPDSGISQENSAVSVSQPSTAADSQSLGAAAASAAAGPSSRSSSSARISKRARETHESDSDDGTKFRFRRRRG